MMNSTEQINYAPYSSQSECLSLGGTYIPAQCDEQAIVVYRAFQPTLGHLAVEGDRFRGAGVLYCSIVLCAPSASQSRSIGSIQDTAARAASFSPARI